MAGADRPAQLGAFEEDPDLGHVARVVADDDLLADVVGQDRVEVSQPLKPDSVGMDLAGLGDGQQQQVQALQRVGQVRQEPAGVPAGLG